MFAYDKRAFSHGCMRVQDPPHYAEVLLSLVRPNDGYTEDRIKKMIAAGSETDIQFPTFIPVNLTYQTAFVDDDGKLQFRDDVYGRDKALIAILKGDDRKVADIPSSTKRTFRTAKSWRCPTSRRCSAAAAQPIRRRNEAIPAAAATISSRGCSAALPRRPAADPAPARAAYPQGHPLGRKYRHALTDGCGQRARRRSDGVANLKNRL